MKPHAAPADDARASRATLGGLGAVALWASLAALTVLSGTVPPFQLTAMGFAIGTVVGVAHAYATGQSLRALRNVPPGAWALGLYGLLGYHVCYFIALRSAPPLDASLINYLWPLLIVVLAGFLPRALGGRPLTSKHVVGALIGFSGTVLVLLQGRSDQSLGGAPTGYFFAFAAAVIWSTYSVASRLFKAVPSTAVIGCCAGTAIGAAIMHCLLETWVWPATSEQWLAIGALGVGPLGLAFYLWDEGMKHGDIVRLGLASYATPLLSTLVMALFGLSTVSPMLILAAVLISIGAAIAGSKSSQ